MKNRDSIGPGGVYQYFSREEQSVPADALEMDVLLIAPHYHLQPATLPDGTLNPESQLETPGAGTPTQQAPDSLVLKKIPGVPAGAKVEESELTVYARRPRAGTSALKQNPEPLLLGETAGPVSVGVVSQGIAFLEVPSTDGEALVSSGLTSGESYLLEIKLTSGQVAECYGTAMTMEDPGHGLEVSFILKGQTLDVPALDLSENGGVNMVPVGGGPAELVSSTTVTNVRVHSPVTPYELLTDGAAGQHIFSTTKVGYAPFLLSEDWEIQISSHSDIDVAIHALNTGDPVGPGNEYNLDLDMDPGYAIRGMTLASKFYVKVKVIPLTPNPLPLRDATWSQVPGDGGFEIYDETTQAYVTPTDGATHSYSLAYGVAGFLEEKTASSVASVKLVGQSADKEAKAYVQGGTLFLAHKTDISGDPVTTLADIKSALVDAELDQTWGVVEVPGAGDGLDVRGFVRYRLTEDLVSTPSSISSRVVIAPKHYSSHTLPLLVEPMPSDVGSQASGSLLRAAPNTLLLSVPRRGDLGIMNLLTAEALLSVEMYATPDVFFVDYRALRIDHSVEASPFTTGARPSLLRVNSGEVEALLGPPTPRNPIALAARIFQAEARGRRVFVFSPSEVSQEHPFGTPEALKKALEFARGRNPYHLVLLSSDRDVLQLAQNFCVELGGTETEPLVSAHRVYVPTKTPTRAADLPLFTMEDAYPLVDPGSGDTYFQFVGYTADDLALIAELAAKQSASQSGGLQGWVTVAGLESLSAPGVAPLSNGQRALPVTYHVIAGNVVSVVVPGWQPTWPTTSLAMYLRGEDLNGPKGYDADSAVEALTIYHENWKHPRLIKHLADEVTTVVQGRAIKVDGAYGLAAFSGMIAANPQWKPLNRKGYSSLSMVQGTSDVFSDSQLGKLSGAGLIVPVQAVPGSSVVTVRRDVSSDTSTRVFQRRSAGVTEDMLTRHIDRVVTPMLGPELVTTELLDTIAMLLTDVADTNKDRFRTLEISDVTAITQDDRDKYGVDDTGVRVTFWYTHLEEATAAFVEHVVKAS